VAQVVDRGIPADSTPRAVMQNKSLLLTLGMVAVAAGFALPAFMTGKLQLPDLGSPAEVATKSAAGYTAPDKPEPSNSGMLLLRLVLGTTVVTGLSIGVLWSTKRWLGGGMKANRGGNQLRLLESLPLNYRCSVHLLQAGHCQVLAAVDGSGIKTLIALAEPFESTLRNVQVQESALSDRTDEVIVPMSRRAVR
jgi:flagellar biogenesis protein FliO